MKKHPIHHLQLRVRELGQLFNSLDPSPFLNKDLDREAEVFIESWAQGLPSDSHLHITVHLQHLPTESDAAGLITEAIHNYFSYKAGLVRGELHRLLREGRTSLLIGISFLTVCLLAADASKEIVPGTHFAVAREGLTILGWVALWRPLQIFFVRLVAASTQDARLPRFGPGRGARGHGATIKKPPSACGRRWVVFGHTR